MFFKNFLFFKYESTLNVYKIQPVHRAPGSLIVQEESSKLMGQMTSGKYFFFKFRKIRAFGSVLLRSTQRTPKQAAVQSSFSQIYYFSTHFSLSQASCNRNLTATSRFPRDAADPYSGIPSASATYTWYRRKRH